MKLRPRAAKCLAPGALVVVILAGCGDGEAPRVRINPVDSYREGFIAACADSGHDDDFDCHGTAADLAPQNLGDADPYAAGYVAACDEYLRSCPKSEYRYERRRLLKSLGH
jgi:hypothetical protein